jgi:putative cell wall-binding protein
MAGWMDRPVLLCNTDDVPQATRDWITNNSITDVIIVGGTGVVSDGVKTTLDGLVSGTVTRIGGANRYRTARLVAEHAVDDGAMDAELMVLASGENWPDALCAATLSYVGEAPLLLTSTSGLSGDVKTFMDDYAIPYMTTSYNSYGNDQAYQGPMSYAIGGPGALPDVVFNEWATYW